MQGIAQYKKIHCTSERDMKATVKSLIVMKI